MDVPTNLSARPDLRNLVLAEYQYATLWMSLLQSAAPSVPVERRKWALLLGAAKFGQESCALARESLLRGDRLNELVLARPLLDIGVRLLYAAVCPDGWNRYFCYFADERLRWARGAVKAGITAMAEEVAPRQRLRDDFACKPMPPKLPEILGEIIAEASAQGEPPEDPAHVYQLMFKVPHTAIHGDPGFLIGNYEGQLTNGRCVHFMNAAYLMTRVVCRYLGRPNPDAAAERFALLHDGGEVTASLPSDPQGSGTPGAGEPPGD
jgi:hypothetical protein